MAFAAKAAPRSVHEHEQEISASHEIRQPNLLRRAILRESENLPKHRLAHYIVGRVVACRMPNWRHATVKPCHLHVEPVAPLRAQRSCVRREPDDFVAEKQDELGLRLQAPNDRIHASKSPFVRSAGHPRAGIAVHHELMAAATRDKRRDRICHR